MKTSAVLLICLMALGSQLAQAVSKRPPKILVRADAEHVALDLRHLIAETTNVEIARVSVCLRVGSRCSETLWQIEFPPGWNKAEIEVLGNYPDANTLAYMPGLLHPGGSYNAFIHFKERSHWPQQTVSNTVVEFCLAGEPGNWKMLDDATCLARRNAEDQQGVSHE